MELVRKLIKFTIALTISILGTVIIVNADPGVVTGNGVNFRSGPGTGYNIYACLPRGTFVTVDSAEGSWYKITYNGVTGYMSSDYVSVRKGVEVDRSGLAVDRYGTTGETIVNYAAQFLGTPYVYGGSSPSGFDCSGFVYYVLRCNGINVSRTQVPMYSEGTPVSKANLQPGDLVFFQNTYKAGLSHVGIYVGDGQFIHAPSSGRVVSYADLNSDYYTAHYYGAARYTK